MPVIGVLGSGRPADAVVAAFHQGLSETGYVEGQTLRSSTAGRRASMIGYPISSPARSM
jgi:hypothetical protein